NIIKKVSGQKFVYKFVSQIDPSTTDLSRSNIEEKRDTVDCNGQLKGLVGGTITCQSKGLPQRTCVPPISQKSSSRNDYMKSGLYSTFTIQSLQTTPTQLFSQPIKTDRPNQQLIKTDRTNQQSVCVVPEPRPASVGGAVDTGLQVIVTQPSPCPTPALSPHSNGLSQSPALEPPQIFLTSVGDSLTPLLSLGPSSVPQLLCNSEPEPTLRIVETQPTSCMDPGVRVQQTEGTEQGETTPKNAGPTGNMGPLRIHFTSAPSRPKKPRGLELPSAPTLPPGLSLDKVNAAVNSLLAPGSSTNTLTPTVITSHALTPVLLTPSPLPSTIHFWSTLSPIAPRSPAKLSFQ
ncbi:hypothetical protein NL108_006492, partial [Boleophthalmus pectinirostris]